jgi:hypothetical protein
MTQYTQHNQNAHDTANQPTAMDMFKQLIDVGGDTVSTATVVHEGVDMTSVGSTASSTPSPRPRSSSAA